ncbi:MAG: hypothetical protein ERJ69_01480 [Aphanocapsa feldmannii 288cV]|nr:MAG: hypothetical protein ERJ69_01480 [Aphanocapsa feldmannii 288cV]
MVWPGFSELPWLRHVYKLWSKGQGRRTKGTSDVQSAKHASTWRDIAAAMREAKVENGKKILSQAWKTNWEPILNEAIRVLDGKNTPTDGYELLKVVLKKWKHAPATQRECGHYLATWMEFGVRWFKISRQWLITEFDKEGLIPKKPRVWKKLSLRTRRCGDLLA